MKASPTGGTNVEYKFRVGYQDAMGWHLTELRGYTTGDTCTWQPTVPHTYSVVAMAREVGSTAAYQVADALTFTVAQ